MTTIIGIKANSGIEGIVVAADRQLNHYDDPPAEKFIRKEQINKITYGRDWIIGDAGGVSNHFSVFLNSKKAKMKEMIYSAVQRYYQNPRSKKTHFPEVNEINTLVKRNGAEDDCLHSMLLAAKVEKRIGLWYVDEFGNLKESAGTKEKKEFYLTLGTGEDYVAKHITALSEKGSIDHDAITIPEAINLATKCLEEAEQDPNTSGLDLAVLTSKGVDYYGHSIQQTMEKQKKSMINRIKKQYQ
ncbi:MAG: hypothetical protein Q8R47_01805 [Nanoarchaeota archaeon]|nr:hypothetical protein [Nanoarchaeota archaeon]